MRVLVTAASRHGGSSDIAHAIAEALRGRGLTAELLEPEEVEHLDGFDAAVIGSGVYAGHWLPAAWSLVHRHADRLSRMPVWLFSSGPLGACEPKPVGDPPGVAPILAEIRAREHVVFAGTLDPRALNLAERLVAKVVHAPDGDFRDWPAIRDWAGAIADTLASGAGTVTSPGATPARA